MTCSLPPACVPNIKQNLSKNNSIMLAIEWLVIGGLILVGCSRGLQHSCFAAACCSCAAAWRRRQPAASRCAAGGGLSAGRRLRCCPPPQVGVCDLLALFVVMVAHRRHFQLGKRR